MRAAAAAAIQAAVTESEACGTLSFQLVRIGSHATFACAASCLAEGRPSSHSDNCADPSCCSTPQQPQQMRRMRRGCAAVARDATSSEVFEVFYLGVVTIGGSTSPHGVRGAMGKGYEGNREGNREGRTRGRGVRVERGAYARVDA
eukprot:366151-Chlamydomonas_euryale.AAC.6